MQAHLPERSDVAGAQLPWAPGQPRSAVLEQVHKLQPGDQMCPPPLFVSKVYWNVAYSVWHSHLGKVLSEGTNPGRWPLCCLCLQGGLHAPRRSVHTYVCGVLGLEGSACSTLRMAFGIRTAAEPALLSRGTHCRCWPPAPHRETARLCLVRLRNQTRGLSDPGTSLETAAASKATTCETKSE